MSGPGSSTLQGYYAVIEQVISGLGVAPDICRVKDQNGTVMPGQWNLVKGSANIYVDVYSTQDGYAYCCVASPVMKIVTANTAGLYEKLLKLNHDMYAASFSINQGWVWLRILRECAGMDAAECRAMFDRVGWYADQYDDDLKKEFGA